MPHLAFLRFAVAFLVLAAAVGCGGGSPVQPGDGSPATVRSATPNSEFDYQGYLEVLRKASGIKNPPETELIRVILPEEEGKVWKSCMQAAGFDVRVTPDGGMAAPDDLAPELAESYKVADYVCYAQYPVDQTKYPPSGEAQVKVTYRYYVDKLTPCLEAHGIAVSEPPSWQAFRDSYQTDQQGGLIASGSTWYPYQSVDSNAMSTEDWDALNAQCLQGPSLEDLLGG